VWGMPSAGMAREIEAARTHRIPVVHADDGGGP